MKVVEELSALKNEVSTLKDFMPKTKNKEKAERKEENNQNIKCFFCGKHYSHQRYLTRHMNMKHKAKLITLKDADTNVEEPKKEEIIVKEKTEKETQHGVLPWWTADDNKSDNNKITEIKKHTGDETAAILIDDSEDENGGANFEKEIEEDEDSSEEEQENNDGTNNVDVDSMETSEEDLEPSRDFFVDLTNDIDYKLKLALNRFDQQNYNKEEEVAFSLTDVNFHIFTQPVEEASWRKMFLQSENNDTDKEENYEETALTLTLRDVERYHSLKNIFSKSYHKEEVSEEIQPVDKQNSFAFTNADNDDADDENIEDDNEDEEESNDETIFAHEKINYSIYGIAAPNISSDSDSN